MVYIKKIIPILLIVLIIIISIYSLLNNKEVDVVKKEVEIDETQYGDVLISEDTRLTSNYKVDNLDKVLIFIDPYEMQNYDDLLTLYAAYLPMCIDNKPEIFYEVNMLEIRKLLGIYSLDDYLVFYNQLLKQNITKGSLVDHIEVLDIVKEANLLKSSIRIHYDSTYLDTFHYLNYLYIEKESYLFLYTVGEVLE